MAVALVRALAAYLGMAVSADQTAEIAGWLESERLGLPGGKEDHYVSASGGIRSARTSHGETAARLLAMPVAARDALSRSILLFHVPITSGVPEEASPDMEPGAVRALHELSCLAEEMESALGTGDLTMVGRLLEVSWEYRRRLLDPARAAELDRIYADASAAGAAGARLSGREMLLVFSPPERREHVRAALGGRGFREIRFGLTNEGARLLAGTATDPSTAREIVAERVYP
jgi:D-glycero-alpha-D-manno-heptose-7-phosphate kinase